MKQRADVIYVWVAKGALANDILKTHCPDHSRQLVKVGVTTWARGRKRVSEVAKQYGFDPDIRCFERRPDAELIERSLLRMGSQARGIAGDGRTEFRFMSVTEIDNALKIAGASQPKPEPRRPSNTPMGTLPEGYWEKRAQAARQRAREANPPRIKPSRTPPKESSGAVISGWVIAISLALVLLWG